MSTMQRKQLRSKERSQPRRADHTVVRSVLEERRRKEVTTSSPLARVSRAHTSSRARESPNEVVRKFAMRRLSGVSSGASIPTTPIQRIRSHSPAPRRSDRGKRQRTRNLEDSSGSRAGRVDKTKRGHTAAAHRRAPVSDNVIKTMKEVRVRKESHANRADDASSVSSMLDSEDSRSSCSRGEPDEDYTEPSSEPESEPSNEDRYSPIRALTPSCEHCEVEPIIKYIQNLRPLMRLQASFIKLSYFYPSSTLNMPATHTTVDDGKIAQFLWPFIIDRLFCNWAWQEKLVDMLRRDHSEEAKCVMSLLLEEQTGQPTRYYGAASRSTDFACNNCVVKCLPCARLVAIEGVMRLSVASLPRDFRPGRNKNHAQYFVLPGGG